MSSGQLITTEPLAGVKLTSADRKPAIARIPRYVLFNVLGYSLSTCFFTSLFVYVVTGSSGWLHAILTNRALRYVGSISYMMYLLHKPALNVAHIHLHMSWPIGAAIALVGTFAMASLTWHFGEKQLMQMGKRITRNLGVRQVAPASVGS